MAGRAACRSSRFRADLIELVLNVPLGAVSQTTQFRLTPLSAQGLPGLLPLGWSPLAAFDVRADSPVGPGLEVTIEGLPDGMLHLARFDSGSRAWTMVQAELAPTASTLTVALEGTGAFALVTPDADPAPVVPAAGEALPGVAQADLPATAVGQAAVQPAILPPSGGKATGRLFVQSPSPLLGDGGAGQSHRRIRARVGTDGVRGSAAAGHPFLPRRCPKARRKPPPARRCCTRRCR
jgi:hypothetical protein